MVLAQASPHIASEGRRRLTILGSTGSVGVSTLDIVDHHRDFYQVEALTAHRNVDLLIRQARQFRPDIAVIGDSSFLDVLRDGLAGTGVTAAAGAEAIVEAASRPVDWVMAGIVGAAGLAPTLAAVRTGAVVALANKECLVCAGNLMMREVAQHGARLLPVDSEHNAIFQVLDGDDDRQEIRRLILTASGGPFRTWSRSQMAIATPEQAVSHPVWSMGAKISVDSATMMNKGLEIIEAHFLFGTPSEGIDALVHPQSIVHSMVEFVDGSILAQLGTPDMRTPIGFALGWPDRIETRAPRLDLASISALTFEQPDETRFPALGLARAALNEGGGAPTILNAANEAAVQGFMERRIGFLDICSVVEATLERIGNQSVGRLDDVYHCDLEARTVAAEIIDRRST